MSQEILSLVKARAQKWLDGDFDEATKNQVKHMMENDQNELIESFYQDLEFGTGGLRGIMGAGTNRMNIYTVRMATQGLCNYLKLQFPGIKISVAVAHDSRNNSRLFAEQTAGVFAANDIRVYLFDALRPTPELSFAVRNFGCQSGVVITASHNPKEYNGYKAYWDDGGQLIPPHDKNVITEVQKISGISDVKYTDSKENITIIGKEIDEKYIARIKELSLSPELIQKHNDLKIVYTPIHGTGVVMVPMAIKAFGFTNIIPVPEQNISDGNFPTVISPNPEVPDALSLAIKKAQETGAELVLATDPDADRVGIAVKNNKGEFVLLNGNQTGSILIFYLIKKWAEKGKIKGQEYIVKTIVTSELMVDIAKKYHVKYYDVLTGFKYIAEIIEQNHGLMKFIGGGEESYGYLAGDFVRDKDAVMACALIAEMAAWAKEQHKTLWDILMDMYLEFGLYKESLLNVTKKGKSGQEEIQAMMEQYRKAPPAVINQSRVAEIRDYQLRKSTNLLTGVVSDINLPKSNVLQFFTEDGSKISIRPSGTEPKIKFYYGVREKLENRESFESTDKMLSDRIDAITKSLNL